MNRHLVTWTLLLSLIQACTSARSSPHPRPLAPTLRTPQQTAKKQTPAPQSQPVVPAESSPFDFVDLPLGHESLQVAPEPVEKGQANNDTWAAASALRVAVPGLREPPQNCRTRIVVTANAADASCTEDSTAWASLADALEVSDVALRDRKLWKLERCRVFPHGLIRALRAELDPNCGDVIIEPFLAHSNLQVSDELQTTLVGLVYAARLNRAVSPLTPLNGAAREADIVRFGHQKVMQWRDAQMQRLAAFEHPVNAMPTGSYGQTVATLALATAWYELKAGARRLSIPDSIKKNFELRSLYYVGLDDALESSSQRAMQLSVKAAALASRHGIRTSPIAKAWFSATEQPRTYPWLLGKLLLPVPPAFPADTPRERAAYHLPAFYAGMLISTRDLDNTHIVRGLIANGLALPHRQHWAAHAPSSDVAQLLAYARIGLARRTFDTIQFDEAIRLLESIRDRVQASPELQLLRAVATAARTAYRNVESLWDETLDITHCEPLRDFAGNCDVPTIRAFAFADCALLRSLNAVENRALELEMAWAVARQVAAGTDAEPCIASESGFLRERRGREHRKCTLADTP